MSCISFVTDPVTVFRCYKLCVFFLLKQSLIHKCDSVDLYAELVFVTYITCIHLILLRYRFDFECQFLGIFWKDF